MKVLAIIPARGGSKGVPKKNIRTIDGKPLIAYSIETGLQSNKVTDVVVSTDAQDIMEVAKQYQADAIKRNPEYATDNATIEPVIREVLENRDEIYDVILLLQPTAPIREIEDIDKVIEMFEKDTTVQTVVSVVELEDIHPAGMYKLDAHQDMIPLHEDLERKRRQDLEPVYLRNGAIYATRVSTFLASGKLINTPKKAYVMPESKWANVDTERDLLITELLIKEWKKGNL